MEITSSHALGAMRNVMKMATESIFNGETIDSMTPGLVLLDEHEKCANLLTMINEFQRNMEPINLPAVDVDAIRERFNYIGDLLGL